MVTSLQKCDVKVHLSNKEIGPWLLLLLRQCAKPVCGCQDKTSGNELNQSVNRAICLINVDLITWVNNLSDKITIDKITTKVLMQSERRISCCTSSCYLMPLTLDVCTASSRTWNSCKTLNCSYSGCTNRTTTSMRLHCSHTAAIQSVLDQLAPSGPAIAWWTCCFLHDSLCLFSYIVCVRQFLLFLAFQSNPHLPSSTQFSSKENCIYIHC